MTQDDSRPLAREAIARELVELAGRRFGAEAARALGLRFLGTQWRIVIPQALRVALPSLANEYISIVKLSSLVSVISLTEILMVGQRLYSQNFLVMETMVAVAFYYVLIVTLFDFLLKRLERFLDVTQRKVVRTPDAQVLALANQASTASARPQWDAGTPALQAARLHKAYNDVEVLGSVNLRIQPGEVVSVIGPSGSGKTTLIRLLNGLEQLDNGEIRINGQILVAAQLRALRALLAGYALDSAAAANLDTKLASAQTHYASGGITGTCNDLNAFINETDALWGKKLSVDQATQLLQGARDIRLALQCR